MLFFKTFWRNYHWPILGILGLFSLVLGFIGFDRYFEALDNPRSYLSLFYLSLQLIVMESGSIVEPIPWQLEIARFLSPFIVAYTAWQAAMVIFDEQIQIIKLRFLTDHSVICGLGRKGLLIVRALCARGERVIVIEQNPNNIHLEQVRELGVIVLLGNASDPTILNKARIQKAKQIIGLCNQDGINAEIAVHVHELIKRHSGKVVAGLFHIFNPRLCELLRGLELTDQDQDRFRLEFFNVYERGARALLDKYPPFSNPLGQNAVAPQIILVGLGNIGKNVFFQLLRRWQRLKNSSDPRLRITLVDQKAEIWLAEIKQRIQSLDNICEIIAIPWVPDSLEMSADLLLTEKASFASNTLIYVCRDDEAKGLSAALALQHQLREYSVPIIVCMSYQSGLTSLLTDTDNQPIEGLIAFPLFENISRPDLLLCGTHEILARAIHEDYRRHQIANGQTAEKNPSMVPWEALPSLLRESNFRQADHIGIKLKTIHCGIIPMTDWQITTLDLDEPEIEQLAELEHTRWNVERFAEGWHYAPGPKDINSKISPYLVPWKDLPEEIKEYDRNTVRGLPAFLAEAGFQMYRLPSTHRSHTHKQQAQPL